MRIVARFWNLGLLAVLVASCGPAPTVTGGASPSSSATPSPAATASPTPQLACSASNRCLALVQLRGSNSLVVRDISDIAHPKTVGTFAAPSPPQFINANELSYVDYVHKTILRVPLSGSPKTIVVNPANLAAYLDWSPDGSTLVYTTSNADTSVLNLNRWRAGQDIVLASMPPVPAVGCSSVASCPTDTWDVRLLYSRDGKFISFVNSIVKPTFRLWTSDGKVLKSADAGSESMSVWSGGSLYFRDAQGVEVWRDGVVTPFLPGVAWIRPKASPGGGQIVYQVRDAQRWSHTPAISGYE